MPQREKRNRHQDGRVDLHALLKDLSLWRSQYRGTPNDAPFIHVTLALFHVEKAMGTPQDQAVLNAQWNAAMVKARAQHEREQRA